ncbi:MAG: hypothetical protein AAF363_15585 [Bacteroidota bacterium]
MIETQSFKFLLARRNSNLAKFCREADLNYERAKKRFNKEILEYAEYYEAYKKLYGIHPEEELAKEESPSMVSEPMGGYEKLTHGQKVDYFVNKLKEVNDRYSEGIDDEKVLRQIVKDQISASKDLFEEIKRYKKAVSERFIKNYG